MIGLLIRRSNREIRMLYYRDEEKDMGKERNRNIMLDALLVLRKSIDLRLGRGHLL